MPVHAHVGDDHEHVESSRAATPAMSASQPRPAAPPLTLSPSSPHPNVTPRPAAPPLTLSPSGPHPSSSHPNTTPRPAAPPFTLSPSSPHPNANTEPPSPSSNTSLPPLKVRLRHERDDFRAEERLDFRLYRSVLPPLPQRLPARVGRPKPVTRHAFWTGRWRCGFGGPCVGSAVAGGAW